MKTNKKSTSVRLSPTAEKLIDALSKKLGVSKSAVFELAIRAYAEQQGIGPSDSLEELLNRGRSDG